MKLCASVRTKKLRICEMLKKSAGLLRSRLQDGRDAAATLTQAMLYQFWKRYASIGVIKLLGDVLNFAAPFLLQALLRCASTNPFA